MHLVLAGATASAQDPAFVVRADPARVSENSVERVEQLVRAGLVRLGPTFPGCPVARFEVHVHRDVESVPDEVREHLHPGTPGLARLDRREIHLILEEARSQPPNDLRAVVDHELVHILLHDYAGDAAPFVPRWFHEGLAQQMSGEGYLGGREEDLLFDARADRLIRFTKLRTGFPDDASARRKAYAQSYSFVDFLQRRLGLETLVEAARGCDERDWYRSAFSRRSAVSLEAYRQEWIEYLSGGSGAAYRILFQNCFSYVMIVGFVLLALAGIRRWNRDLRARAKLEREELFDEAEDEP